MCFTSLYISVINLFTPSLQFIFLFCFYEMLKRLKRIIFFSVVLFFFVWWHCNCVCVVSERCTVSLFTVLCKWSVGCVPRKLYSQSALQLSKPPSELWYKKMPCSICSFVRDKKTNKKSQSGGCRRLEVRGRTAKREPLDNCSALLASPPSRISKYIIILTFFFI